jgi:hypothetical protein
MFRAWPAIPGRFRGATGWEPKISLGAIMHDVYADACEPVAADLKSNPS